MKKIMMTLLAAAVAVPLTFAADAPKADANAPAGGTVKTAKKHHKKNKKTSSLTAKPVVSPAK